MITPLLLLALATVASVPSAPDGLPGVVGPQAAARGLAADEPEAQPSPWYLQRGTDARPARPADDVPDVVMVLAALLRDGRVPGFYDGQFAATRDRFADLVRVAQDRDMHHTIRIMAVMALQEAADGEALRQVLEPLLLPAPVEFGIEYDEAIDIFSGRAPGPMDVDKIQAQLDADLSRHARFALAKDGQPQAVLDRIQQMRQYVERRRNDVLDPGQDSRSNFGVWRARQVWFDIAYHYQQFDDYKSAARWFRELCDNLRPEDTRMSRYNLACIAALTGNPEQAVVELRRAYEAGFLDVEWMDEDGDLQSLRERADYLALRAEMIGEVPEEGPAAEPVPQSP